MIEDVTVWFTNGNEQHAERVKIQDSGWISVRVSDGWVYYPERQISRIVSRDD